MFVLANYTGGELDHEIMCVYNNCMSIRGFVAERRFDSVDELRRLWFEYSSFDPEDYAIAVDGDRVYGMVFARASGYTGYVWLCIDSRLLSYYLYKTVSTLLSWARHVLSRERVFVVRVSAGYEKSLFHHLIRVFVEPCIEAYTLVLMEYCDGVREIVAPKNIVVREACLDDIPGVVDVWNSAFREYEWASEWSVEDAIKWYTTRKLLLYVAVDKGSNRVVGYVDGEVRKGFDGEVYGYVYTLAVHPSMQGRGLGRTLLQYMVNMLINLGVKKVYLDAVQGLENYYAKQGFKIKRRSLLLITTINNLPQTTYTTYRL